MTTYELLTLGCTMIVLALIAVGIRVLIEADDEEE